MPLLVTTFAALALAVAGLPARASAAPPSESVVERVSLAPTLPLSLFWGGSSSGGRTRGLAAASVWALALLDGRLPHDGAAGPGGAFRDVLFRDRVLAPMAAFPRRGVVAGLSWRW